MKYTIRVSALLAAMMAAGLMPCLRLSSAYIAATIEHQLPLRLIADIPVQPASAAFVGQTPRMDYESIDSIRRMLYVAYLGADEVIAFNLDTNKVVAHIRGLPRVHGTLIIPKLHRLYATVSGLDQVATIDQNSLKVIARAAGGDYPDGMTFDEKDKKIFVSDEHGGTDTIIDVDTNRAVARINLGGEVGNSQYDTVAHLVYSDVQTRDDVVALNPVLDKIVARHKLPGCQHDHGLLLDNPHRLAFVACDGNAKLLVMDLDSWKELSVFSVGKDPDVLAFDEELGRLYVAAESGIIAVFQEHGRALTSFGRWFLAEEAHTVAVDSRTHKVYFALENVGGKPVIRVMQPSSER